MGSGPFGDIALDDISYNDGPCPAATTCDFESYDLCGYVNDVNNPAQFTWKRIQGNDSDPDHTYDTDLGHYMNIKSVAPHVKDRKARFLSTAYPATTICVSFWYKTLGNISLAVRTYSFGQYNQRAGFQATGDRGKEWSLGQASLTYSAPFQIAFESVDLGAELGDGEIWLDDIDINFRTCQALGSCDFEAGTCGYSYLSKYSDFDWVILDGYFGLSQNIWDVPKYDHTTNTPAGHFMFLDTNNRPQDKRALMESEVIAANTGFMCLEFYLITNQYNVATLKVNRRNKLTGDMVEVFSTTESLNQGWLLKEVQLPDNATANLSYPYSVVIEGRTGWYPFQQGQLGQLAFDDVRLYNGKCKGPLVPPNQFDCQNGQIIDFSLVCDFKQDCSNGLDERNCGNCDFEQNDLCGYSDRSNGSYKWTRARNSSSSDNIGPSVDHTYNNQSGSYMSVVSNNGGLNGPATLLSPVFPFASSTCQIKFWYITSGGENTYSLNVSLVIDEERKATLFRKSSLPQVVSWTQHTIDLGSVSSKFQIAFEGRRAFFFNNFVSIDDITFERCALPFTNATCSNAEFKCKRGNCVSKERLCDFVDDCGDLSDETAPVCFSYSKCTFDFSLCDWQIADPMASFKWIRFTGPTLSDLTGPSRGLFSLLLRASF